MVDVAAVDTRTLILDAARRRLLADGYAGLSTRKVAEEAAGAGQPAALPLRLQAGPDPGAVRRGEPAPPGPPDAACTPRTLPLWQRYERACDYLEDDLDSGYVRVLQEMIAAGWSNAEHRRGSPRAARRLVRPARRGGPRGRAPPRAARPVHRRGAGHPGRLRLLRLGGAAAARLRPGGAADPLGAATRRRADPTARGRVSATGEDGRCGHASRSRDGYVERDGVKVHYEVFGAGEPTVLLLPTWSIIHSRHWKMQIPYLARHCRVVTFDGRGNGRSDRPTEPEAYAEREFAADALAVMDATGTDRAVIVALLDGRAARPAAGREPSRAGRGGRVHRPELPGRRRSRVAERTVYSWEDELDTDEGWAKYNRHYWLRDYEDFLEFFISQDVHRAALHQADRGRRRLGPGHDRRDAGRSPTWRRFMEPEEARELAGRVRCPVLVIHGER